jgi:hypothetical protein
MCAELVRVNWMVGEERFETAEAVLEDISSTGGCVQMEQAVPTGAVIMLSIGGQRFNGRVRYCVSREFGFFVGIKFAADTVWSQDLAMPAHLTNMEMVVRQSSLTR